MKILWSILICSIPNRWGFDSDPPYALELLRELDRQTADYPDVEVLLLYDNQKRTTGEKRNFLLDSAKGEYISFLDDDDMVASDYVSLVHKAILESKADVVAFGLLAGKQETPDVPFELYRQPVQNISYSIEAIPPSHVTGVWRASCTRGARFLPINHGEDFRWVREFTGYNPRIYVIPRYLYYWNIRPWVDQSQHVIPNQQISWSILICSVPNRYGFNGIDPPYAQELMKELYEQTKNYPDVEILLLYDNQKRTTGAKRTALLHLAKGSHISFIDDDDMISPDYVETLRSVILDKNPDVAVFKMCHNRYMDHAEVPDFSNIRKTPDPALGQYPYHTDVWRTSIARSAPFPAKNHQEDTEWMKAVFPKISWCCLIDQVLYYWNYRNWIDQSNCEVPE